MTLSAKPELIEQDNYEVALGLAREQWKSLDPQRQAARAGAEVRRGEVGQSVVSVPYLGQSVEVTHPEGIVRRGVAEESPALWEQILILHYLCSTRPVPDSDRVIAYCEIPDGRFYDAAYQRRTKQYLLKIFGSDPERIVEAAKVIGAEPATLGDRAVSVRAFPFADLYLVLWRGDDEFPADASVLLGERIQGFFDAEDIAVLAGLVVSYVANAASAK
ncbi:MAG: DUF3786 domain-containing protein [Deltaproteobacteria bacterium]|nr:DUF3786 domain-containing protein [Deltaproteobacteria bacterium]